jgi:hypothetical protein
VAAAHRDGGHGRAPHAGADHQGQPRPAQAAEAAQGTWDITAWDPPSYFEWEQKTGGTTSVAGHRVEALGGGRARLTLTLDMRGLLIPIMALFYRDLTNRYMALEAEGMKRAAESDGGDPR